MIRRLLNVRKALLRSVLPLLRRLPLPVASRLIAGIGRAEYRLLAGLRRALHAAVARANDALGCTWDVAVVSRDLAGNQVRWRTRDLLLDGVDDRRAEAMFIIEGRSLLDEALAQRRGAIMITGHYGAHLLPAHWLLRERYALRFYMERPRHVSQFLFRQFESAGPLGQDKFFISRNGETVESAGSILRAARVLKAAMIVYLAGDVRWSGPHTEPARFMGRTYRFSATWASLAAMTGAPVVPVFCQMEPSGTYHIEFQPPFSVPADAPKSGQLGHWVQLYLRLLEDQIRIHPANSNEYFFWPEQDDLAA